ncbi:MAG: S49 family peptidase [Chloroflexi bacterium]|nr:S49 family peptidase [Chloroflexota bacterium]
MKRFLRRVFTSFLFFMLVGVALGIAVAVPVIPRPKIVTISISGPMLDQAFTDDALDTLRKLGKDNSVRAVVLQIDSPGGGASLVEPVYLELLRLRQKKPVIAVVGSMAASGGYYLAAAADYIYAQPTSQVGSIGVFSGLPQAEQLAEDLLTSGLFKATGGSKRKAIEELEMVRQEFVSAVTLQRGGRLTLSDQQISLGALYLGTDALRYGLIDEIGPVTVAIERAAEMARIRNYEVVKKTIFQPLPFFFFFSVEQMKAQISSAPGYYYLYFESK